MTKKNAAASLFAAAIVLFALLGNAEGGKKTDVYMYACTCFPLSQILKKSQLRNFFFARKHSRKELRMCIWGRRRVRQATSDSSKNSLPESCLLPFFPPL